MSESIKECKKCGKQISEGKYCKLCKAERKEKRQSVLKKGTGIALGVVAFGVTIVTKGKFDGHDKS